MKFKQDFNLFSAFEGPAHKVRSFKGRGERGKGEGGKGGRAKGEGEGRGREGGWVGSSRGTKWNEEGGRNGENKRT